jgi:hypothetical protein
MNRQRSRRATIHILNEMRETETTTDNKKIKPWWACSGRTIQPKAEKTISDYRKALFALMAQPEGATMRELIAGGLKGPALAALRSAKKNGYDTEVIAKEGEVKRYRAWKGMV